VNSALVSQVFKHNIYFKTDIIISQIDIRIVVTTTISNLPELPRGVIMGHFSLDSINHGPPKSR